MNPATPFLYIGLAFASIAATGLIYGLAMRQAEEYTLVTNKAVEPQNVKVTQ